MNERQNVQIYHEFRCRTVMASKVSINDIKMKYCVTYFPASLSLDAPSETVNALFHLHRQHNNTTTQQHSNTATQQHNNTTTQQHNNTTTQQQSNTTTQQPSNTTTLLLRMLLLFLQYSMVCNAISIMPFVYLSILHHHPHRHYHHHHHHQPR